MNFEKSRVLQQRCHQVIPGGAHTYAKGDDQFPINSPSYIFRGKGCHVWDVDGNEFIEYGMGLRAVTLGHAYDPVDEAAYRQMRLGNNYTRPSAIELDCAERLLSLLSGAEMVKFAKNGSDVTTAAVKLARAYTGRDLIAICAEQPFFSTDDWFIGATPMSRGIPESTQCLTVKFHYNDIESVRTLFAEHPGKIACCVLEAATSMEPVGDFLQQLQRLCHENRAVLILDEMITGFRWHIGGAQKFYGITPDLSTFGKGLANGFSLSALVGKRELMELGGINHSKERVFLLSTTHGAENHCLAASIETMRIYKHEGVVERLYQVGEKLERGIAQIVAKHGLEGYFGVLGKPCNLVYFTRDPEKNPSQAYRTLFLQETIKRGFIMPSLVVSYSHTDQDIERTIEAIDESLVVYRKALDKGVKSYLEGRAVKPVFRKFS